MESHLDSRGSLDCKTIELKELKKEFKKEFKKELKVYLVFFVEPLNEPLLRAKVLERHEWKALTKIAT